MSRVSINDLAWKLILDGIQFEDTGIAKTTRLQYKTYEMLKPLGDNLPLALYPGDKPIEAFIFQTAGEVIEQAGSRIVSAMI